MEPPVDVMTSWQNSYTRIIIIFVLVTFVQLLLVFFAFNSQWLKDIQQNFPKYRCNPVVIPMAGLFGYNTVDNFNFCVQGVFNAKAAEVFIPIYGILGTFQQVLATVVNAAMSIRGMFSNFFTGVENFITSLRNKIQYLMNSVRMSFIRIFNLMGKVYGSMFAVLFMGQSGMIAAFNLADNDLVKFLFEFCFAPDTPVEMADGSFKPIIDIQIGDTLAKLPGQTNAPVVESVFRFSGHSTPMVRLDNVILSSQHYVLSSDGSMIPARSHPDAVPVPSIPELVCLNVSGHRFFVGQEGLIVADYDEHSSEAVIAETQAVAARALNGGDIDTEVVAHYTLGIGGETEVELHDGTWKRTDTLVIGDSLRHAGVVLGLVQESCSEVVVSPQGIVHAPSQFVYDHDAHRWVRAAQRWPGGVKVEQRVLYNVISQRTSAIHMRASAGREGDEYIRDYREVPLPDMEAAYEKEFLANK